MANSSRRVVAIVRVDIRCLVKTRYRIGAPAAIPGCGRVASSNLNEHLTEDVLAAWATGHLRGWERTAVKRHLEVCEACRRSVAALKPQMRPTAETVAAPGSGAYLLWMVAGIVAVT